MAGTASRRTGNGLGTGNGPQATKPNRPFGVIAKILHTTEVTPLPNYRLRLSFNTGEQGEVDLSDKLDGEVFGPLRDQALFSTARQDSVMKTVVWNNGADLAPEFLLDLMHRQQGRRLLEKYGVFNA